MQAVDKDGFSTNLDREYDLGMGAITNKEAVGAYKIFSKFIISECLPKDFSASLAGISTDATEDLKAIISAV
jgi:hypothetical protein